MSVASKQICFSNITNEIKVFVNEIFASRTHSTIPRGFGFQQHSTFCVKLFCVLMSGDYFSAPTSLNPPWAGPYLNSSGEMGLLPPLLLLLHLLLLRKISGRTLEYEVDAEPFLVTFFSASRSDPLSSLSRFQACLGAGGLHFQPPSITHQPTL